MAGSKLEIGIGADITDFSRKIKEVEYDLKELSKLKVERLKLGLDTAEINNQIKDVKNTLRDLKTTSKDTGAALSSTGSAMVNFGKQAGNGSSALTAFSRIAQDAPYGIIGVGNNITNTAEQFGYLVKQTGSASGAFKALLTSLTGAGGILLAVSLVTTAFTVMSQQGLTVGDVIDKLTGNFDALASEMSKVAQESAKNSGSEIANFKALLSVAQDENKSRKDRLIAVQELQKEFPAYFGNLSKEKILNGDVTGTVKELTKAIVERAKASAYSSEIGKLAAEEFLLKEKQLKATKALAKEEAYRNKINQNTTGGNVIGGTASASNFLILKGLRDTLSDINKEIAENKKRQDAYTLAIEKSTSASIKLRDTSTTSTVKPKESFNTPQVGGVNSLLSPTGLVPLVIPPVDSEPFANSLSNLAPLVSEASQNMQLALLDFNTKATEIINGALIDTFSGIGSAIGNALSSGGNVLTALGATLLDSLGGVLTSMGKMAIQVGVGLLGIQLALKTLNPYVAIAAGIGLVALGSFFSNQSKSIGGTMGGGGGGRQASTSGGSNSNFSSSSGGFSSATSSGGTVVFEIAGQKLIGVLSNTLNANKRLGGQLGIG